MKRLPSRLKLRSRSLDVFRSFLTIACLMLAMRFGRAMAAHGDANVSFSQSAATVQVYDFIELTIEVSSPRLIDPFTEVSIHGEFSRQSIGPRFVPKPQQQDAATSVDGFCDSDDGSLYRIRFMPSNPGKYS